MSLVQKETEAEEEFLRRKNDELNEKLMNINTDPDSEHALRKVKHTLDDLSTHASDKLKSLNPNILEVKTKIKLANGVSGSSKIF